MRARARSLAGSESARVARAIARKHPILHGVLVPLAHRLRGYRAIQIELRPIEGDRPSGTTDRSAAA